ncbi:MAG TPA: UDP-N-acetylmuramoyl-tripeptide--D-alanyl-D-alanine ligase [Acidobacteriaceae bacterium]
MKLSLERAAAWMGGELLRPSGGGAEAAGYSIDSRTIVPGELFFAVSGEHFDAHRFVAAALECGAVGAVVSRLDLLDDRSIQGTLLLVDDPLSALQRLAAAMRRYWVSLGDGRLVIGITGSAGKTTTKEAVAAVLSSRYRVLKSEGNLNNHFGVPLQLLRLEPADRFAVIEMGMSHAGDIALLTRLAAPQWGVVTNVGHAHGENFADGIEGIARAKHELIAGLAADAVAFLNSDDPRVDAFETAGARVVRFGRSPRAAVRAEQVDEAGAEGLQLLVCAGGEQSRVRLQLLGAHNVSNALAAIAVGLEAGVPLAEAGAALARMAPGNKRGEVLLLRGAKVINDCYNSNPEALQAMIGTLAAQPAERRILVAGEMLELGPAASELHAACGRAAAAAGLDQVIGVRGLAAQLVEAAREAGVPAAFMETPEQAGAWLARELRPGDAVLLKASRGVRLERALTLL